MSAIEDIEAIEDSICLDLYKNLADALDTVLPELYASEPIASVGFSALHVTQVTLFIFAPCLVVEQYGVEVERIKLLLMHKLFDEPDDSTKGE
ncbi:hypothetical protein MSG28_007167 [Choristoneura fumiferana]|uniref:Uncharacterized protein n=1 Tax=Choristoneura fumiferana TaxID=7141 RepID=A0ACC0JMS2_CHOFU|nr:hypothetical protein MSG28_007167 [Choristoneura fumiferana]